MSEFYVTGGTLRTDARSYLERAADRELDAGLRRGEFCFVLTSRQTGKSSLMVRTATRLREDGIAVAVLDLTRVGLNVSPEQWYFSQLLLVGEQLGREEELERRWEALGALGPLHRFMEVIGSLVRELPKPSSDDCPALVIFVDEIDAVRSLPFTSDEYFAAIRQCHNRAADAHTRLPLGFCLLGVATPSELISHPEMTPFNIGTRIALGDFTPDEAAPLAQGLHACPAEAARLLRRVLYWTGGHPYLTQRLCRAVSEASRGRKHPHGCRWSVLRGAASARTVDQPCQRLFIEPGATDRDDNLAFARDRMLKHGLDRVTVLELYRRVLTGRPVRAESTNEAAVLLRLAGVVEARGELLRLRNRLYGRVFNRSWISSQMPDAERRRQLRAYLLGAGRTAALASALIAVISGFAIDRSIQARRLRQLAYGGEMGVAARAAEAWDDTVAIEVLERQRPQPGTEDLRGFEWRRLWGIFHGEERRLRGHDDLIFSVATSPEGNQFASASFDGTVRLWNARTGDPEQVLHSSGGQLFAVAYSPVDSQLATAGDSGWLELWDWRTGRVQMRKRISASGIHALAYTPDGAAIITVDEAGTAARCSARPGEATVCLARSRPGSELRSVAVTSDGSRAAFAGEGDRLRIVALSGNAPPTEVACPSGVQTLAWSRDGRLLAVGWKSGRSQLLDLRRNRWVSGPQQHRQVNAVAVSPDGRLVASASWDATVRLWDAGTGRSMWILRTGELNNSACFTPDGRTLLTGGNAGEVKTWDLGARKALESLDSGQPVRAIRCGPSYLAVSTSSTGYSRLWPLVDGRAGAPLPIPQQSGRALDTSSDGRLVLAATPQAGPARIFATGHRLTCLGERRTPGLAAAALSSDGQFAAVSFNQKPGVEIWGVPSLRRLGEFRTQARDVGWISFSPDGRRVAAAGGDFLSVAELRGGRVESVVSSRAGKSNITGLAFSPDSRQVACCDWSQRVSILDVSALSEVRGFVAHSQPLTGLAYAPDGRTLATGDEGGEVKLWSLPTCQNVGTLRAHRRATRALAFSRDGNLLATGGDDGQIHLFPAPGFGSTDPAPRPPKGQNYPESHSP